MEEEILNGRYITKETAIPGKKVVRGPDWHYNNQDDNMPYGIIQYLSSKVDNYYWVSVQWNNDRKDSYRIEGYNDIIFLEIEYSIEEIEKNLDIIKNKLK